MKLKIESRGIDMRGKILTGLVIFIGLWLMVEGAVGIGVKIINKFDYRTKCIEKEEQIKILEQALTEQIQETEVYRGILEEYQTEGIINE